MFGLLECYFLTFYFLLEGEEGGRTRKRDIDAGLLRLFVDFMSISPRLHVRSLLLLALRLGYLLVLSVHYL
jgi:hypothetical protein